MRVRVKVVSGDLVWWYCGESAVGRADGFKLGRTLLILLRLERVDKKCGVAMW